MSIFILSSTDLELEIIKYRSECLKIINGTCESKNDDRDIVNYFEEINNDIEEYHRLSLQERRIDVTAFSEKLKADELYVLTKNCNKKIKTQLLKLINGRQQICMDTLSEIDVGIQNEIDSNTELKNNNWLKCLLLVNMLLCGHAVKLIMVGDITNLLDGFAIMELLVTVMMLMLYFGYNDSDDLLFYPYNYIFPEQRKKINNNQNKKSSKYDIADTDTTDIVNAILDNISDEIVKENLSDEIIEDNAGDEIVKENLKANADK